MDTPDGFAEEIDYRDINFQEIVGRGAFGVVSRAEWHGQLVAVKLIETDNEKKAFVTELKQLSRVDHPNIIKLYGASRQTPVFLVMEYAEGGSLYNVLHAEGTQAVYTSAHAISWCLQCALGVEYLHGMKPKPLVHRDLKPPNLLLNASGTVLKICDFGTACDAHTHMTNNKGSAAWMAPEVFEGNNYSEKCDVFSFGIILWEVLTRRKPFDEIGGPAFRIMWAVHSGTRPPLIQNCPKPIENLMIRCWSSNPVERPPFVEVVSILKHVSKFFHGENVPLVFPGQADATDDGTQESIYDATPSATGQSDSVVMQQALYDFVCQALDGEPVPIQPTTPIPKPVVVEVACHRRTSAPASLATSHESLQDPSKSSRSSTPSAEAINKRYSADLSKLEEQDYISGSTQSSGKSSVKSHRRSGSYGTPIVTDDPQVASAVRGHRRTGSHGNSPLSSTPEISVAARPQQVSSMSVDNLHLGDHNKAEFPQLTSMVINGGLGGSMENDVTARDLSLALMEVDHQIQPLTPCNSSPESMTIYQQHLELAEKYLRVQTEIALLTQQKHDLTQDLRKVDDEGQSCESISQEITRLNNENASLESLYKDMKADQEQRMAQENRGIT